ncbi:Protein CBG23584 [Caenorhabditis briggsae]|uniref:Protein CBG23584 n=1 Tax=Caenorhabditis briggsae TaxID=6238 RepID=A8WIW1_CAEBR|nr:Protein CBG23584 [Caenorhabditis briggsae]CAP20404.2 Protein CBG23584 [Caenorhabditis briggsae]
MNSGEIFEEIFNHFKRDGIDRDWRGMCQHFKDQEEKSKIRRIVTRVVCGRVNMFEAGKEVGFEVEALNASLFPDFRQFLLKFESTFQKVPPLHRTTLNTQLLLKFIDFLAENPENQLDYAGFLDISRYMTTATNVLIKDLVEMAVQLYPDDKKPRKIGAQDLLDGVEMSGQANDPIYTEEPFLKLKKKSKSAPESFEFESKQISSVSDRFWSYKVDFKHNFDRLIEISKVSEPPQDRRILSEAAAENSQKTD